MFRTQGTLPFHVRLHGIMAGTQTWLSQVSEVERRYKVSIILDNLSVPELLYMLRWKDAYAPCKYSECTIGQYTSKVFTQSRGLGLQAVYINDKPQGLPWRSEDPVQERILLGSRAEGLLR